MAVLKTDRELLDWLQEQGVDVIYLEDGRAIIPGGGSVREAIKRRIDSYSYPADKT